MATLSATVFRLILWLLPWSYVTLATAGVTLDLSLQDAARRIAVLIQPSKLETLAPRGANPRIQKCVYWLEHARAQGLPPAHVLDAAIRRAGYTNRIAADLTKQALLRNLEIAEKLGCLDANGLEEMRRGNAATVGRGPYRGDQLSVDHIIPRAVAPELDHVIANLELMPERMNSSKSAHVGARQKDLARKLVGAGLLSERGRRAIDAAAKER